LDRSDATTNDGGPASLRRVPALADLDTEFLQRLAEGGRIVELPAGATVIEQGGHPSHLHVLLAGQVGLTARAKGRNAVVEVLQPVDQFILAAALSDAPHLLGACTLAPSRLLLLPAESLRSAVAAEPRVAAAMVSALSQHYRMLVRQVKDLKLRSSTERLAAYLLTLAREQRSPERVQLPFDKRTLAGRLGMTPESLSRAFAALRASGVETQGPHVQLGDVAALGRLAALDVTESRRGG
jgi:CRP/FNR family transcriptional regulator, transcriptional activator FtrB